MNTLVVYASGYGQSERIAQRIATVLRESGHRVTLRSAEASDIGAAIGESDAVILGGSIRRGRHLRPLETIASENAAAIAARPNAFFSVSLSAAGTAEQVASARRCVDKFVARTRWQPEAVALCAGALAYSKYNPLLRLVMRLIVRLAHGDTDASRDYEYTDWAAVERFASQFGARLAVRAAAD